MQSTVIRTGEPMLINDAEQGRKRCVTSVIVDPDGTVSNEPDKEKGNFTQSLLMVPIFLEGRVVGVVQVSSFRLNAYTESHVRLLSGIVQQLVIAVQNARLYEEVQSELERRQTLEAELELRVADRTKQLEAANRELEGFTYNVSHDMRAPLRAIISAAMILLEDHRDQVEPLARQELQRMATAASKMGRLIDDLLQYSRLGRMEIERRRVDLSALVDDILGSMSARHSRKVDVHVEDGLTVMADPLLLKLAMENLLDNALKYGRSTSGNVSIGKLEGHPTDTFFVRDDGIGFDPQYAPKIFEPFERLVLDSEYPGTGIGLANVKRIIERHGGKIWAESTPGQGATFFFTLAQKA